MNKSDLNLILYLNHMFFISWYDLILISVLEVFKLVLVDVGQPVWPNWVSSLELWLVAVDTSLVGCSLSRCELTKPDPHVTSFRRHQVRLLRVALALPRLSIVELVLRLVSHALVLSRPLILLRLLLHKSRVESFLPSHLRLVLMLKKFIHHVFVERHLFLWLVHRKGHLLPSFFNSCDVTTHLVMEECVESSPEELLGW